MLGHVTRNRPLQTARTAGQSALRSSITPRLRQRPPTALPSGWCAQARAGYYFDATWHTAQTLRRLMRANLTGSELGLRPPPELLSQAIQALLYSIRPGMVDDQESQSCFNQLLRAHLSGLEPAEIAQLGELLKDQRFDCAVAETVIDDPMILKFGFANGPPHQRMRTLMSTKDLHDALDEVRQAATIEAAGMAVRRLSPAQAAEARDALASLATRHTGADLTLEALAEAAASLVPILGRQSAPVTAVTASNLPPASYVDWQEDRLIVDAQTFTVLRETGDRDLYACLMRDMLELLLAHRRYGAGTALLTLSPLKRALLFQEVEQVLSLPPTLADRTASARAAAILTRSHTFGSVQICPTAGVQLGHAWIAPTLSLIPNRKQNGRDIGTRFMRSGFRLEPTHCTINEWGLQWLNAKENEELYPADFSWQLRVPAERSRLQQAATEIMQEWQREALPYRFAGTAPGMPATGCRVTVWHSVQRALDDDTRGLFEHFVRGLPAPESPTELALRLEQFMDWLTALAAQS